MPFCIVCFGNGVTLYAYFGRTSVDNQGMVNLGLQRLGRIARIVQAEKETCILLGRLLNACKVQLEIVLGGGWNMKSLCQFLW